MFLPLSLRRRARDLGFASAAVSRRRGPLGPRLALPLALSALGCGPSFEAIQEGDLRFAHCDRLDLDPKIAPSHRLHCWREWRRIYTYGQTRDRVEYAQRRIAEVVSGDTGASFDLPASEPKPPASRRNERKGDESKKPTDPGRLRVARSAEPSSPPARGPNADGGGTDCQAACRGVLESCTLGCHAKNAQCASCEPAFVQCVEGCSS